jgi:YidC/Oxa1 family membrane protein insertase
MDRRTLITFFIMTLALVGVNMFFEYRHQEDVLRWQTQQQVKLAQQREQLQEEIEQRTVDAHKLPVKALYSDAALSQQVGIGTYIDKTVLALPLAGTTLPQEIYVKSTEHSDSLTALSILYRSSDNVHFAIYGKAGATLPLAPLSNNGRYDLQLALVPVTQGAAIPTQLGEYRDGTFSLPAQQLRDLYRSISATEVLPTAAIIPSQNALVLLSTDKGFLPVGIYIAHSGDLLDLRSVPALTQMTAVQNLDSDSSINRVERYYVLENAHQQLVFSSRGGALVEINLPLRNANHPDSLVKPIEADREMEEEHPYNDYFPSNPYMTAPLAEGDSPVEHLKGQLGGYYPLLRRDLVASVKGPVHRVPAAFYATNVVSEYPETAELHYRVKEFTPQKITFEAVQPHRRITKTYAFDEKEAPYNFTLTIQVEGDNRGLWLTSGVPEVELISGSPAPSLSYRITRQGKADVRVLDLPTETSTYGQIQPNWLSNSNGFFGLILSPLSTLEGGFRTQKVSGEEDLSRLLALNEVHQTFKADALPGYMQLLSLKNTSGNTTIRVFAGPFATELLKGMDARYSDKKTGETPDYIAVQSSHGWFEIVSGPFAKFLFVLMSFFHYLTGSWGIAIILLTVAVRVMLYPLNAWSLRSNVKMQQIMPEVTALQEKYKKDPQKAQLEVLNLYRERGVNPVSGCIPLLIQLPFLIGMFDLLKTTFELRGACFIPGWIDNLAAPDVAFSWGISLPFIGDQLHLLPLISGALMLVQQRMAAPNIDPAMMTEKDHQQRTMAVIFGIMFALMFYHFPSGLNIYWISSTLLAIVQQWWTRRNLSTVPVVISERSAPHSHIKHPKK